LNSNRCDMNSDNLKKNRYWSSISSSFSLSTTKKIVSVVFFGSMLIMSSTLYNPMQNDDNSVYGQVQEEQLQKNQQSNENKSTSRIFGCADFGELFHCDPFLNELVTYRMVGNWSIITPVLNDNPRYVDIGKGSSDGVKEANKALEIADKSREFVQFVNNKAYNSKQFSVSFNIYKTSSTSNGHVISHVNKEQTAGWFFDIRPPETSPSTPSSQDATKMTTDYTLSFGISKSSGETAVTKRVPLSKSANIVGTFDNSSVKLYKDGSLIDDIKYDGEYTSDPKMPIHIGSGAYCSSCNRWAGVIGDVRIYNKSLSQDEIKNTVLSTSATGSMPGLVGHWPLDGNLSDVSNFSNNGNMITPMASMAFTPDARLFYTIKNTGEIKILKDNRTLPVPFATLHDVYADWEQGLLGIVIDPNYQTNKFVYAYYTAIKDKSASPFNKIVRFTDQNNTGTDMRVLMDNIPASRGFHSGGALAFGPDDKLYITVGDATEHEYAQDPSIPLGKTLRINRDGTIPKDNPFPNSPVYTLGHRNLYGIAFDWSTGTGILTENGDQAYDEINLIEKGGNYGFPFDQPANVAPELSTSPESIKPLRSYFQTVAPTQAIYYTGDKYPFLTGKFVFGTFTGSIHALTIQNLGTKKQLIEEDHIRLRIVPFDSVNGIAASPNGDIYFGGYYIYKLDVVDVAQKRQDTFPVVMTSSPEIGINDIQGSNDADYLYANLGIDKSKRAANSTQPSSSYISFKIPTRFLPGIQSITYTTTDGGKVPADFAVDDSNPAYSLTRVELPQNITDTQLFINGTGIRTSARNAASINLYDDFENATYTLTDGEISPDKKWRNIEGGQGSMGVRNDINNTNNGIFFISPRIAKSVAETFSGLATTTRNFSNFDLSVDVKTEKQTRENESPKPWETVWIFFRYADDFHYYWFILKPSGIELGKKDCDTCNNPFEGQVFLYTDEIPTLKLGEWSNWRIKAIGNNITIALNGTEVVEYTDSTMSPKLESGPIGIYAEGASVAVDNFRIEEILPKK
jgi:glucose/arabinose dehydrogenase